MTVDEQLLSYARSQVEIALLAIAERANRDIAATVLDRCKDPMNPELFDRALSDVLRRIDLTEYMVNRADAGWESA